MPVGGYPQEGVRPDDPNDVIPHEDRRDLRGARVFFAWLNNVDIKEDNSVDTWVEDPRTPGKGHVRHHLIDFGNSLGIFGWKTDRTAGFTHLYDVQRRGAVAGVVRAVASALGGRAARAACRRWATWRAPSSTPPPGSRATPGRPFERFDRFDGFWARAS